MARQNVPYKARKGESEVSILLREHLRELDVFVHPEHKFHPTRKWRFDWADIPNKVAFEIEGGIWIRGRHSRGAGYQGDLDKYNQAIVLGWTCFRFSTEDVLTGKARQTVLDFLNARKV